MKIQLTKIPSIVRRLDLPQVVEVCVEAITAAEGNVIAVEALEDEGKNNVVELANGRLGRLAQGDVFAAAFGKRRALREFSGDIPDQVCAGDELFLLAESGVVGAIKGVNSRWGRPLAVRVLGSLVAEGRPLNIKENAIPWRSSLSHSAPIIAVVGTCMDTGKTTVIRHLIKHFRGLGQRVAAVKLAGVGFRQDPLKFADAGAAPVLDFVDAGLPSTCGNGDDCVAAALGVLAAVNEQQPDLIIAECGDGILGEYNVDRLLTSPDIQRHLCATIVSASDLAAAWGATRIMADYGLPITLITGPVVNNETGVAFVESRLAVPAESNLQPMPKTVHLIEKRLSY